MTIPSILGRIVVRKRAEVIEAKGARPFAEVLALARAAPPARSLRAALFRPAGAAVRVLAEIKRASPSAGPIRPGADPAAIAVAYAAAGAAAISVLTDRDFFDGDLGFLGQVRAAVDVPLLRKDFVLERYQIAEARAAGADAVLLIAAILPDAASGGEDLAALIGYAADLGMDALVEAHDVAEADRAIAAGATLIGVNHRDLGTFTIDMTLTAQIAPRVPSTAVLVGESGIRTAADIAALGAVGAHAVLVGESLMRADDPGAALRALLGAP
jgi:indole-3-glycerol phosphate synthase